MPLDGPYMSRDGKVQHYSPSVEILDKAVKLTVEELVVELRRLEDVAFNTRGEWLVMFHELERKLDSMSDETKKLIRERLR